MEYIIDGFLFDTSKEKLIFSSNDFHPHFNKNVKQKSIFYKTNCGKFIILEHQWMRDCTFFGIQKNFKPTGCRVYETDRSDLCDKLKQAGAPMDIIKQCVSNKSHENNTKTNYEKTVYLKSQYEELKKQLEKIKNEMLTVKQKAKEELNWILNDNIEG